MNELVVIAVTVVCIWIVGSAALVTMIIMNSSMVSRQYPPLFATSGSLGLLDQSPISEDFSPFYSDLETDECEECGNMTFVSTLRRSAGMCRECYAKYRSTA